jgi:hypothetical protein
MRELLRRLMGHLKPGRDTPFLLGHTWPGSSQDNNFTSPPDFLPALVSPSSFPLYAYRRASTKAFIWVSFARTSIPSSVAQPCPTTPPPTAAASPRPRNSRYQPRSSSLRGLDTLRSSTRTAHRATVIIGILFRIPKSFVPRKPPLGSIPAFLDSCHSTLLDQLSSIATQRCPTV